jgi:hypothetical protein
VRRYWSSFAGILANAASVGANTVYGPLGMASAPVRLAALTAVTSVDSDAVASAVVRMSSLGSAKLEGTSTPSTMWMTLRA